MESQNYVIKGSCACGRVKYTGNTVPEKASHCHCTTCQKVAGPFLAVIMVPLSSIQWTGAAPAIWKRSDVAERGHCAVCGSSLSMWYYCLKEYIFLTTTSVDESTNPLPAPSEYICVGEKASWYEIPDDGVPRFDGMEPHFTTMLEEWRNQTLAS